MVLVAAIAAGVLLNTAGLLQSQAEATGQESTAQVSNVVQIDSSTGDVGQMGQVNEDIDVTFTDGGTDSDLEVLVSIQDTLYEEDIEIGNGDHTFNDLDVANGSTVVVEVLDSGTDSDIGEVERVDVVTDTADGNININVNTNSFSLDADTGDGEELADHDLSGEHVVDQASVMVSLGPGSDPVDLSAATFEYVGDRTQRGTVDELNFLSIKELENGETYETDDEFDAILQSDTQLEIELELGNEEFSTIKSGEDAQFMITTADGAQTVELLMAPSTLTEESAVTL